jgi:hypothetical protein
MPATSRSFNCAGVTVLQLARTLHGHGLRHQAALETVDADLNAAWWAALLAATEAAEVQPATAMRQGQRQERTQIRNAALAEARPLLQDAFFYAAKAYPTTPNAADLLGRRACTAASTNPLPFNAALQAAALQVAARQADLVGGGMPAARVAELLRLAAVAQAGIATALATPGQDAVATAGGVAVLNALWALLGQVQRAAEVAFRGQPATQRLFRLYAPGPEAGVLTAEAARATGPGRRVLRLASHLSAGRLLSLTVAAPAGPVRVALLLHPADADAAPAPGLLLATTLSHRPHRLRADALGPAGAQYLLVENALGEKATVRVRVLPVGA